MTSGFASFTEKWHNKPYGAIDPARPELDAKNKFVVIAGGSSGIGKAIATAFAQAGAQTIGILGRRVDKLTAAASEIKSKAKRADLKVEYESADLTSRAAVNAAAEALVKKSGDAKIDIFVCSADVMSAVGPVEGYDETALRSALELSVIAPFNAVQSFTPLLAANAHLLHVSTGYVHMRAVSGLWMYTATKAAITKLFDSLQEEHPEWHVVQFQPGVVATGFNAHLGVVGQDEPELAARFAVWLSSPEAAFLKGKFVWVNWDVDELKARANDIAKDPFLLKIILNGALM